MTNPLEAPRHTNKITNNRDNHTTAGRTCDAWCIGCKYSIALSGQMFCDYLMQAGARRGCDGGFGCDKFVFDPDVNMGGLCKKPIKAKLFARVMAAKRKAYKDGESRLEIAAAGYEKPEPPKNKKKVDMEDYEL